MNNPDEINLCKGCNTMKHLNPEGYCGRCGGEDNRELREYLNESECNGPFCTHETAVKHYMVGEELLPLIERICTRAALDARIDELEHITVYEIADEVGAWYEPDKGYQQTISSRLAELLALQSQQEKTNAKTS